MTPLVRQFVRIVPDPERMHWFDIGTLPAEDVLALDSDTLRIVSRLPFEVCAVCFQDALGTASMLRAQQMQSGIVASGLMLTPSGPKTTPPVAYLVSDEGIRLAEKRGDDLIPVDRLPRQREALSMLGIMRRFLAGLDQRAHSAWLPTPKPSFLNARRASKGLPPAVWTWRTVKVEPHAPEDEVATPGKSARGPVRAHDRRGHWRRLSEDRIVWVRPCRVGDPARGESLHDYRVVVQEGVHHAP